MPKYNKAQAQKQREQQARRDNEKALRDPKGFWMEHFRKLEGKVSKTLLREARELVSWQHAFAPCRTEQALNQILADPNEGRWDVLELLEPQLSFDRHSEDVLQICRLTRAELLEAELINEYGSLQAAKEHQDLERIITWGAKHDPIG